MIYTTDGLFPFILSCGVSIGLVSYHVVQMKASKRQPIASTSKTTSLGTKPSSKKDDPKSKNTDKEKDKDKPKPVEKPKATGKLDWSNAKTKDMKAAEVKEAKMKEEGKKKETDAKKVKEAKKKTETEKPVKAKELKEAKVNHPLPPFESVRTLIITTHRFPARDET